MRPTFALILLLIFAGCSGREIRFTKVRLSSGDTLLQEETPYHGFVDSGITVRLFIEWADTSKRELVANGGPPLLSGQPSTSVWRHGDFLVIRVGSHLLCRRGGERPEWVDWIPPSSPELFALIRGALSQAGEPFHESHEYGPRLTLDKPRCEYLCGISEQQFFLPYAIASIDFDAGKVITKRFAPVECLPEELIFTGDFGRWRWRVP